MAKSFDTSDTIAAIASAHDGALRGVVRISGPRVRESLQSAFSTDDGCSLAEIHEAAVLSGTFQTPAPIGDVPCDVYYWPDQRSYTRQPCAEIHTIGSLPILDAVLARVCESGVRLAEPGEFTMRAFLAGRIDLTQAEAVLGVIDARNNTQLQVALTQLAGGLARPLHQLREQLLDVLAQLEAGLDFVEEDIEFITAAEVDRQLAMAEDATRRLLDQVSGRAVSSEEPRVVLVGYPNVGKSSLFNALVGNASAIVSPIAGTTRDFVSQSVQLGSTRVQFIDTAGIELTGQGIAEASQQATDRQLREATLQLFCLDAGRRMNAWERNELGRESEVPRLVVLTKCDRERRCEYQGEVVETSCLRDQGVEPLGQLIARRLEEAQVSDQCVSGTAVRCRESLRLATEGLARARTLAQISGGDELIAAELRNVLDELGSIVGVVYTDDILDRIFSRFCIGK